MFKYINVSIISMVKSSLSISPETLKDLNILKVENDFKTLESLIIHMIKVYKNGKN